jgi:toxin ParE1/3/4
MRESWYVSYTEKADRDLDSHYKYIAKEKLEPINAANQINRIIDATATLDHMPFRHRLYANEPWRSRGLRVLPVDNYIVLYLPKEAEGIVDIITILHGTRDIDKCLAEIDLQA